MIKEQNTDCGRVGKIGRLPSAIRGRLNERLREGQTGQEIVRWLNGLPEVQAIMAARFRGQPVLECNLSRWRRTGYLDWQQEEQAAGAVAALFQPSARLQPTDQGSMADRMSHLLAANMALELKRMNSMPDGDEKFRLWRELTSNVLRLRRGDLEATRTRLQTAKANPTGRPEPIQPDPV